MNGSIKDRGNGKYQLIVTLGSDYRGKPKRHYKTISARDKEAAQLELAVFYNDCVKGRVPFSAGMTFEEFVELWDKEYAKMQLKKSTYTTHKRNLKYNFEVFNKKKLSQIKPVHIRRWISYLYNDRGLSPKTVKNNYSLLHCILQKAVLWEYLEKNPADNIELPKAKPKEAHFYTESELSLLLEVLEDVPIEQYDFKVGILLGLFGGLRRGEICGLDESDVNFENNTIRIRQTRMVYGEGGLYVDTPKTLKSIRTVTLPQQVIDDIQKLIKYHNYKKEANPDIWYHSEALLRNGSGTPLYPQSLFRWFVRFQKSNGLPHLSVHGLRHTHTAMLRGCDVRLEEVSKRLGHSQKSTTLNIYSHLFMDRDTELANTLGEKFLK